MSITALYRKYRPKKFGDMIGQDHVVTILTNQIKKGGVGHAYIFCGSRGTGKTTAAKIFAQAVNCQSQSLACNRCDTCIALQQSSNMDVLEIDAASNNGVDEIRNIVETVKFVPSHGKYKVYIVDEVHMLTINAFNALLKTLEEPPPHAIFVLATTEVHKLPATILSRCMRLDFKLVERTAIAEYLVKILKLEKINYEQSAVDYIAMRAEGSVRDALSICDTCIPSGIKYEAVLSLLGTTDRQQILSVLQAVNNSDIGQILVSVDNLARGGASMSQLAKDIVRLARDMLVTMTVQNNSILAESQQTQEWLNNAVRHFTRDFLISVVSNLSAVDGDLRYSTSPRIVLESSLLSLSIRIHADLSSISDRISRLEEYIKLLDVPSFVHHNATESRGKANKVVVDGGQQILSAESGGQANNVVGMADKERGIIPLGRTDATFGDDSAQLNFSDNIVVACDSKEQDTLENKTNNSVAYEQKEEHNTFEQMLNSSFATAIQENNIAKGSATTAKRVTKTASRASKNVTATAEVQSKQEYVAIEVWGRLATWLRKNSTPTFRNRVTSHTEVDIKNGTLYIVAKDTKYLDLSDEEFLSVLKRGLQDMSIDLDVSTVKSNQMDKDSEIERLRQLAADAPFNVKNR